MLYFLPSPAYELMRGSVFGKSLLLQANPMTVYKGGTHPDRRLL